MTAGRGAWTTTGHRHGSRFYLYASGEKADGLTPDKDLNFEAVFWGVYALQHQILRYGATGFIPSGVFGPKTRDGLRVAQRALRVIDDGVLGPATAKALWRSTVAEMANRHEVPPEDLWGMISLESGFDPGAVGSVTPDRGLCQINLVAHPAITVAQAFSPRFAINYTAERLRAARDQFDGKGPELQRVCSIAQHNSPLAAKQWYEIGWVGEDEKIARYVALVLEHAAGWSA